MSESKRRPPTPLEDVRWHLQIAELKLGGFWLGIWGRVRDSRRHLEEARLALQAHEEQAGAAVLNK